MSLYTKIHPATVKIGESNSHASLLPQEKVFWYFHSYNTKSKPDDYCRYDFNFEVQSSDNNSFRVEFAQSEAKRFSETFPEAVTDHIFASSFGIILFGFLQFNSCKKYYNYMFLKIILNSTENLELIEKIRNSEKSGYEKHLLATFRKRKKGEFVANLLVKAALEENKKYSFEEYLSDLKKICKNLKKYMCSDSLYGMMKWFYGQLFPNENDFPAKTKASMYRKYMTQDKGDKTRIPSIMIKDGKKLEVYDVEPYRFTYFDFLVMENILQNVSKWNSTIEIDGKSYSKHWGPKQCEIIQHAFNTKSSGSLSFSYKKCVRKFSFDFSSGKHSVDNIEVDLKQEAW